MVVLRAFLATLVAFAFVAPAGVVSAAGEERSAGSAAANESESAGQGESDRETVEAPVPAPRTAAAGPIAPAGLQPRPAPGGRVTSGTMFNPAISVILDSRFHRDSVHGEGAHILHEAKGFHGHHDHDHHHGHGHGAMEPGFSLAGTELVLSASVDRYFDALATLVFDGHSVELEEAYGLTRALPAGFTLKFGKFFSGIGYINSQHPHQWDFVDQALPYQLILGHHGLNDVGVQLTWLTPARSYLLFGIEAFQGDNEAVANYIGHVDHDLAVGGLEEKEGPRLLTGFFKFGPDLGASHAVQFGGFGGRSSLHQEKHDHGHGRNYLEGTSTFWGVDLVYKYDDPRAWGHGDLTLQAEYLRRVKDIDVAAREFPGGMPETRWTQDGLYVQAVYGFAPRFTGALRWDAAGLTNRRVRAGTLEEWGKSSRTAANITFNPTEFSRLRVQAGRSSILTDHGREKFNEFTVQMLLSLGVHGAHRF